MRVNELPGYLMTISRVSNFTKYPGSIFSIRFNLKDLVYSLFMTRFMTWFLVMTTCYKGVFPSFKQISGVKAPLCPEISFVYFVRVVLI